MHDIDRTQKELELEAEYEHEHEAENEGEAILGSLFSEAEHEHEHEAEHEHEHEHEAESPLNETQEMELASELLEVSNEAELEYFLKRLAGMAVKGVKGFVRSPQGRMVGGMLKGFAKKALPIAGKAVGAYFGGPLGAKIGGGLGKLATNLFELELEGLSHEDREFEVARQVVRLGAAAMNRAARAPRSVPPQLTARRAFTSAARVYAPGLMRKASQCGACGAERGPASARSRRGASAAGAATYVRRPNGTTTISAAESSPVGTLGGGPSGSRGYWVRRGNEIVLTGV